MGVASILFRNLQSFLPNDTYVEKYKSRLLCIPSSLSLFSEATHPRSLVISSQVSERGGNGEVVDVLLDNPVIITFSFEAVCLRRIASSSRNGVCVCTLLLLLQRTACFIMRRLPN